MQNHPLEIKGGPTAMMTQMRPPSVFVSILMLSASVFVADPVSAQITRADYRFASSGRAATAIPRQSARVDAATLPDDSTSSTRGSFPDLIVPSQANASGEQDNDSMFAGPLVTTASSLLIVLAVFGALVWVSRRYGSARTPAGLLPEDVARVLGSTSLDSKTRILFVRVGARILVLGQNQNGDPQTLSEITEPEEVERLTRRCLGRPEIVGRRTAGSAASITPRRDLAAG